MLVMLVVLVVVLVLIVVLVVLVVGGYFSLPAGGSFTGSKASGSTQKPPAGQGHCHMALFDAPFLKTMNIFFMI